MTRMFGRSAEFCAPPLRTGNASIARTIIARINLQPTRSRSALSQRDKRHPGSVPPAARNAPAGRNIKKELVEATPPFLLKTIMNRDYKDAAFDFQFSRGY